MRQNTYKGGRAPSVPRPPLSLSKLFELLLKPRIFSSTADLIFQFFVGEAWGERRIMFWKFKGNQQSIRSYFYIYIYIFFFVVIL